MHGWLWLVIGVLAICAGCSRDSWDFAAPGLSDQETVSLTLNATAPMGAQDGWPVYITGDVVSSANPDTLHLFGTFSEGHVTGTYSRSVWGTERFTVGFWYMDGEDRMNRLLDVAVNDQQLLSSRGTEWSILREFQLYVENGQVMVNPGVVDSIMGAQVWYTGTAFNDPNLDWPANPDRPVYWWGTWTTFQYTTHPMQFADSTWTTTMRVRKNSLALIRLQKTNGDELRSGVFVGPVGNFSAATELKNLRDLGGGWFVFEYRVTSDGQVVNLRPGDERRYGIIIGGN
ncbi:MAG: hypothetical protein PHI73_05260 [Patescibacteria group bacterium]|nr:hypothetical protein [Patescibacteria group bacterium]